MLVLGLLCATIRGSFSSPAWTYSVEIIFPIVVECYLLVTFDVCWEFSVWRRKYRGSIFEYEDEGARA